MRILRTILQYSIRALRPSREEETGHHLPAKQAAAPASAPFVAATTLLAERVIDKVS